MALKAVKINATTRSERHCVISQVKDAIEECGAWLMDFRIFSNISICFNIEIAGSRVERLVSAIEKIGPVLTTADDLEDKGAGSSPDDVITGTIQITFVHNDPDLRLEVPAIPG